MSKLAIHLVITSLFLEWVGGFSLAVVIVPPRYCPEDCEEENEEWTRYLEDEFSLVEADLVIEDTGLANSPCMRFGCHENRVMLSRQQLSEFFKVRLRTDDLILSGGTLEQRITLNECEEVDASTRDRKVEVKIHCVYPLVKFNFWYELIREKTQGAVKIDMSTNEPVHPTVILEKNKDGTCTFSREESVDESVFHPVKAATWYYPQSSEGLKQAEASINNQLKSGWLFDSYMLEVKLFIFGVLKEVIGQRSDVIRPNKRLQGMCSSIIESPEPEITTTPHPATTLTSNLQKIADPWPKRDPNKQFNEVDKTLLEPLLGEHACLESGRKRMYVGKPQLSNLYPKTFKIEDLELSNGRSEQRVTLNDQTELELGELSVGYYTLRIPCVAPYIIYSYKYRGPTGSGDLVIENYDEPHTIQVVFMMEPRGACSFMDWTVTDGKKLSGFKTVLKFNPESGYGEQSLTPEGVKNSWQKDYKDTMVQFVQAILQEAVKPTSTAVKNGQDIARICNAFSMYRDDTTQVTVPTSPPEGVWPDDGWPQRATNKLFIEVDVKEVENLVGSHQCLQESSERVYISRPELSVNYLETIQYMDLELTDGSVEQRITVTKGTGLEVRHSERNFYTVSIPCVVPVVLFPYRYRTSSLKARGRVRIDLVEDPLTLQVTLREVNAVCSFVEGSFKDDNIRNTYKQLLWVRHDQDEQPSIREILKELIKGWKSYYKAQVEQFAYAIIREALSQTAGIIQRNSELERLCKLINDTTWLGPTQKTLPTPTVLTPKITLPAEGNWPLDIMWPDRNTRGGFSTVNTEIITNVVGNHKCLRGSTKRIYIGTLQLGGTIRGNVRIRDLELSLSLADQRITMNEKAALRVGRGRDYFPALIPCVAPLVFFFYKFQMPSLNFTGHLIVEISDGPLTLLLTLARERDGTCSLIEDSVSDLTMNLISHKVVVWILPSLDKTNRMKADSVRRILLENTEEWVKFYLDQVENFAYSIVKEAFRQTSQVIERSGQLQSMCTSINESPRKGSSTQKPRISRPMMSPPVECPPPTIWPEDQNEWPDRDICRQFNDVSTHEVEAVVGRHDCLQMSRERVYIGWRQLSSLTRDYLRLGELDLSNGLVNQRITISRDSSLTVRIIDSRHFTIRINCVVPIVVFLYQYSMPSIRSEGTIKLEVSDGPLDVLVNLVAEDDGSCSVIAGSMAEGRDSGGFKVTMLARSFQPPDDEQTEIKVQQAMRKRIAGGEFQEMLMAQLEVFAHSVIKEAAEQRYDVIQYSQDLNRHCNLINDKTRVEDSSDAVFPRTLHNPKHKKVVEKEKKVPEVIMLRKQN